MALLDSLARVGISLSLAGSVAAQRTIQLPQAQMEGGKPLMRALKDRHSSRDFGPGKLSPQTLSNLLWAAVGVSRADGRRTSPTAMNWQEIDVYVATEEGLYLYDPKPHALIPIVSGDVRAATGGQEFVPDAAVNLVFVADLARMEGVSEQDKAFYSATDTGFASQNVYLYCASEGLATVVRGTVDRPALAKLMKLRPTQKIILAQSVGPEKK